MSQIIVYQGTDKEVVFHFKDATNNTSYYVNDSGITLVYCYWSGWSANSPKHSTEVYASPHLAMDAFLALTYATP